MNVRGSLNVRDGDPCQVQSAHGTVLAEQVAVCTHFPTLDRGLTFARMEAQRSYCVAVELGESAPPRAMAMGLGSADRSIQWYGDSLVIGGEGHPAGAKPSVASPERYRALEAYAAENWPAAGGVRARWSAQDPVPYDRLPMIGPLIPRSHRLWVATGWAKWGLTGGTFAARILLDLMDGQPDRWKGRFSPIRLSLRSTPEIAKLGASFQLRMVVDRVTPAEVDTPADVPGRRGSGAAPGRQQVRRLPRRQRLRPWRVPPLHPTSAVCCASTRPSRAGTAPATARATTSTARCSRGRP